VGAALRAADLLFLPLAFDSEIAEVLRLASPGKLGDYLQSGRLVLVHAPAGSFVCDYITRHGCGLVVDQPDVAALVRTLEAVASGQVDRKAIEQRAVQQAEIDFAIAPVRAAFWGAVTAACSR
jgi:non-ribosomal peptide synthetase component E (peptide arylation enzyme)